MAPLRSSISLRACLVFAFLLCWAEASCKDAHCNDDRDDEVVLLQTNVRMNRHMGLSAPLNETKLAMIKAIRADAESKIHNLMQEGSVADVVQKTAANVTNTPCGTGTTCKPNGNNWGNLISKGEALCGMFDKKALGTLDDWGHADAWSKRIYQPPGYVDVVASALFARMKDTTVSTCALTGTKLGDEMNAMPSEVGMDATAFEWAYIGYAAVHTQLRASGGGCACQS
eukprot:gnl/TRDRNA2_/TRDRNA2_132659_c1_seq1.p1 gnl/TRDRNA2_/TRDRNA2_132659_c1~~gnl/TRDRNA2_/TRDRNA2_132659_c1_seq1.p1  ORF type:complete len:228 (+),score=30.66 gnl/TRDRNA2_/TRDRNA2_132659_c1_seq1:113-796(+)